VLAPLHILVVIAPEKDASSMDKESDEDTDKASPDIRAYSIIPKVLYESVREMMDKKYAIFVNALPKKYFEENTIPNSISIPLEEHEKLSDEERKGKFAKIIQKKQLEYPHMMDLEVEEVPIVVFCAHEKCNASDKMCDLLFEAGFKRIFEYAGGQKDYDEKSGKTLEDSSSDDDSDKEESDLESDVESEEENEEEEEESAANDEKAKENENEFNKLTKDGEAWAKAASEDMRKREEENNNESLEEEEKNNNEASDEEPENNRGGGSKRKRRRKRKRKASKVLRGGPWCFSFL
jgi:rhodanese-related sulfurtransferase